jgi:2-polyprenyl-6-hydroxyphenyl methylase/3-demethylubiquinone-9 3-methyltransferase
MIAAHEAAVASRFDALHERFKTTIAPDDYRLRGILEALGSVRGLRLLDLGCGKGRFARALQARGANVVGLDISSEMLSRSGEVARVRASARRLPFCSRCFDAAIAVEVMEHLPARSQPEVLSEARRVLKPGGLLAVVDKNAAALNATRPWLPALVVKKIDEHRGRWMYPPGSPVRERWFWPARLQAELKRWFEDVRIVRLLAPEEEDRWLFHRLSSARLMTLWVATAPGGHHV